MGKIGFLLRRLVLWLVGSWITGCQFQMDGSQEHGGDGKKRGG